MPEDPLNKIDEPAEEGVLSDSVPVPLGPEDLDDSGLQVVLDEAGTSTRGVLGRKYRRGRFENFPGEFEREDWPVWFNQFLGVAAEYAYYELEEPLSRVDDLKVRLEDRGVTVDSQLVGVENLETRLELFRLISGQTGSEMNRELSLFGSGSSNALSGMIGLEYRRVTTQMRLFLDGVFKSDDSVDMSALCVPLSPELTELSKNPVLLYECVVQEQVICQMQMVRNHMWEQASDMPPGHVAESIRRDPDQFVHKLCGPLEGSVYKVPIFFREKHELGLPAYDLPIAVVDQLSAEDRVQFLSAIDRKVAQLTGRRLKAQRDRLGHLKSALQVEGRGDDLLQVVSQRKQQIPSRDGKPGPIQKPVGKWIPLVGQTFRYEPRVMARALMGTLGFIPEELYTKKAFRTLKFHELAKFYGELVKIQKESNHIVGGYAKQRVLRARSQFVRHLFVSGNAESVRDEGKNQVTVDVNGLWFSLDSLKTVRDKKGIRSHVPFAYVDDEFLIYLVENEWISSEDMNEVRLQRAKANNDVVAVEREEGLKAKRFDRALGRVHRLQSFSFENAYDAASMRESARDACPNSGAAEFSTMMLLGGNSYIPQALIRPEVRIPESAVNYFLEDHGREYGVDENYVGKVTSVLQIAEVLGAVISDEVTLGEGLVAMPGLSHDKVDMRKSHDVARTAKDTYRVRQRILNDARYYDVLRMVGMVLNHGMPESSAEDQFMVFRGHFQKASGGLQHQFLEVVYGEKVIRILLAPDKHLNEEQREEFEKIPELNRADYEQLEAFVMTYRHMSLCLRDYIFFAPTRHFKKFPFSTPSKAFSALQRNMEEFNAILLTEFPDEYPQAQVFYRSFVAEFQRLKQDLEAERMESAFGDFDEEPYVRMADIVLDYQDFCERLVDRYGDRLFSHEDPHEAVRDFSVDIQPSEVAFDSHFLDEFDSNYLKKKPWVYDKGMSKCGRSIKIVEAEGDQTIPYAMEQKATRALGLIPGRACINFAGGCANTGYDSGEESPSAKMSREILEVAHRYKANVAPPGTQSGFGVDMGNAWLDYQNRTDHLPVNERAHCFAVSPGGETYYPGNKRLTTSPHGEPYAIGPFDSIVTPFDAGWNWPGDIKGQAPYFRHVEYMEAIYQRLSEGKQRVMVVGNGGLFTIAEAEGALRNNVPIVLTEGTGRFSDLAIQVRRQFNAEAWRWVGDLSRRSYLDQYVLSIIRHYFSGDSRVRLLADFGESVPAREPEQELYRQHFYEFLRMSMNATIVESKIDDLGDAIEGLLS